MYLMIDFHLSSLANQLINDCERNGLSTHGFLQSNDLQQGYNYRGLII